ncbi:MAG: DNA-binding response regulator [Chloroflexi bacterium HGW-Chloroflexi-10]|nr:MAG: DNA-binding response regulator [Chloroflexi bacterium HGW-Chloroflexi-10]
MLKVLLADDHAVVREGIKQIIAAAFTQVTFGEAKNAFELLELAAKERWNIVILDLTMPGGNGLEALKQIKHHYPQLPVLILSMFPEDQYAVRTIIAGAAGYLNKESAPEELVLAIRKILHGGEYISSSVADELVLHARHEDDLPLHKHLSDREYQVLCLISSGKEVKEISTELSLSAKTISTYRTRLLVKMNMKTNAELTYYAIQNGLV